MSIQVTCSNPNCGKSFRVKDEHAGKTTKCPGCGQPLRIPPPGGATGRAPNPAPIPATASRPTGTPPPPAAPFRPGLVAAPAPQAALTAAPAPRSGIPLLWMAAAAAVVALVVLCGGAAVLVMSGVLGGGGEPVAQSDAADQPPAGDTPAVGDGEPAPPETGPRADSELPPSESPTTPPRPEPPLAPLGAVELPPLPAAPAPEFVKLHGLFAGLDLTQGHTASTFRVEETSYLLQLPLGEATAESEAILPTLTAEVVVAKVNAFNRGMEMSMMGNSDAAVDAFVAYGRLNHLSEDPAVLRQAALHLHGTVEAGLKKDEEYDLEGLVVDDADGGLPRLVVTSVAGKPLRTREEALALRMENPEYLRWARFPPGAAATYRYESGEAESASRSEQTRTLREVHPDHLVLHTATVALPRRPDAAPQTSEQRIPRFVLAPAIPPPAVVDSGSEPLPLLTLARTQRRRDWRDTEERQRLLEETVWTSEWAPGHVVRSRVQRDYVDDSTGLQIIEDRGELIAAAGPGTERFAAVWEQVRLQEAAPQVAALDSALAAEDKLVAVRALAAVEEQAGRGPAVQRLAERVAALPWPERLTFQLGSETKQKLVLVRLPPGRFGMGSSGGEPQEQPVHQVTFTRVIYLGETEVTEGQWRAVTGGYTRQEGAVNRPFLSEQHPADGVYFSTVDGFVKQVGEQTGWPGHFRLPTEAEWEYACRAGTTGDFAFGDDPAELGDYAWFRGNAGDDLHPVAQKQPNAWGLFDMHGNALEWCSDAWRNAYEPGEVSDPPPQAIDGYRSEPCAVRGGSWNDEPAACRSASRRGLNCGKLSTEPDVGFRVVFQPELTAP